jgi:hypothetical protein
MSSLLVFYRVYRTGDTVSHVRIFDPALSTIAPLTFSLFRLPPSPLPRCLKSKYTDSVWLGRGGGGDAELCWRPYSAGVF